MAKKPVAKASLWSHELRRHATTALLKLSDCSFTAVPGSHRRSHPCPCSEAFARLETLLDPHLACKGGWLKYSPKFSQKKRTCSASAGPHAANRSPTFSSSRTLQVAYLQIHEAVRL